MFWLEFFNLHLILSLIFLDLLISVAFGNIHRAVKSWLVAVVACQYLIIC